MNNLCFKDPAFNFNQTNMPTLRYRIAYEILTNHLLPLYVHAQMPPPFDHTMSGSDEDEDVFATDTQRDLAIDGYVVVPTELADRGARQTILDELDREVKTEWIHREYKLDAFNGIDNPMLNDKTRLVGGDFAALGNPSSFHSPTVRKLRRIAHAAMVDAHPFKLDDGYEVSQVIDRLMKRITGAAPGRETWHRDVATNTLENDLVFGGWINLDDENQLFSCIKGTHNDAVGAGAGFVSALSDIDNEKIAAHPKHKHKPYVQIPAGYMLIFNERLIHEIVSKKAMKTMLRLFTGWYVSKSAQPHDSRPNAHPAGGSNEERLRHRLEIQASMYLKSGQASAMSPILHWVNLQGTKIAEYTDILRDVATAMRQRNPTKAHPNPDPPELRCPHRREIVAKAEEWTTLDSLQTMQNHDKTIQMWPPYTPADIQRLLPMTYTEAEELVLL